MKKNYSCPMCGQKVGFFIRKVTVNQLLDKDGNLVDQRLIKVEEKLTCMECGHKDGTFAFEMPEIKVRSVLDGGEQ